MTGLFINIAGLILLVFLGKKYLHSKLTIFLLILLFLVIPWKKQTPLPRGQLPFFLNQSQIARITLYQNILNPLNPTFSRLYTNKATVIISNLEINFFESFDINHYFFVNHPLERVGVKETEKLYTWLLPFFLIGLFSLTLKDHKLIVLWMALVFLLNAVFSNRYYQFEILLTIPFLILIGLGLKKAYEKFS